MNAPDELSSFLGFPPGGNAHPPEHPFASFGESASPDGTHVSRTIRFTTGGGARGGGNAMFGGIGGGGGGDGGRQHPNSAVHDLFQSLFSQIGGMTPEQAVRREQAGAGQPAGPTPGSPPNPADASAQSYNRGPPPEPYTRGPPPAPSEHQGALPGGPYVTRRHINWGPLNLTMQTTSSTYVNGQPVPPGEDVDLIRMIQSSFPNDAGHVRQGPGRSILFTAGGQGPGGGREPGGAAFGFAHPLAMLLSGLGGHMGDAVFSDEAMDRIVSRLMEQNQQGTAPGPASSEAIQQLPRIKVAQAMLDESTGTADCPVCLVDVEVGEDVAELPCKHWFHFDCVKAWLQEHDTCPTCRRGITPREGDGNRLRETGEAPRHWQTATPTLSRSNTHEEQPSQEQGSSRQESAPRRRSRSPTRERAAPQAQGLREAVSTSVRNAIRNGILGWMGRPRDETGATAAEGQPASNDHRGANTATTTGAEPETESSGATERSRESGRQNPGDREHHDLEVPDVD